MKRKLRRRSGYRSTRDVDLLGYGESEIGALITVFRTICQTEVADDGITFDPASVQAEEIRDQMEYGGTRLKLNADLAGARIHLQVDIGFGDVITPSADSAEYVWGSDDKQCHPKMRQLISKASNELIRRRIEDSSALTAEVYASLVDYLDNCGALRVPPFDTSPCEPATLKDISRKRVEWFLDTARRERGFPLKSNTSTQALLTHLNLVHEHKPTNAAIMLFGSNPQKFHRTAETKCMHCRGTEYRRPFVSMQVYGGDLFEQANLARDFVLDRIDRAVGVRDVSITAPATYELPPDAVGEAIVNAIAHRDYHSNASVEVRLFADRLEIWNPGLLPGTLTMDSLRHDHPSVPFNPLLAESLYLARYIERVGSGTQTMIELCREAGLPEPQFEQREGFFVTTIWRDWLTPEILAGMNLNERQVKGISFVKANGRITNREYRELTNVTIRTASRDLEDMVGKTVLKKFGATGRNTFYCLAGKVDTK
ncbi:MAG: nucleotidyl transferase AbiEii/AbiGii toxin family protein [Desulfobacteraceae bacterium]|nr:nucleotidyl transferase AbiEii/AbiGii toxin family protein [Desulfobacteraceae bacterium]